MIYKPLQGFTVPDHGFFFQGDLHMPETSSMTGTTGGHRAQGAYEGDAESIGNLLRPAI